MGKWASHVAFAGAMGGLVALCALACTPAEAGSVDRPTFRVGGLVVMWGGSDFSENGGRAPVVSDFYLLDGVASGAEGTDIIAADGVTINLNTGRYNPTSDGSRSAWEFEILNPDGGGQFISAGPHQTLDANDAYPAFGVDGDTDIDLLGNGNRASQFYVASNTAFDIYAHATDLVNDGAFSDLGYGNIRYTLRYRASGGGATGMPWGGRAQDPALGGGGLQMPPNLGANAWTLANLSGGPIKVFDGGRKTAAESGNLVEQSVGFQSRYRLAGAGIGGNTYDLSMGAGTLGATVTYTVYVP